MRQQRTRKMNRVRQLMGDLAAWECLGTDRQPTADQIITQKINEMLTGEHLGKIFVRESLQPDVGLGLED